MYSCYTTMLCAGVTTETSGTGIIRPDFVIYAKTYVEESRATGEGRVSLTDMVMVHSSDPSMKWHLAVPVGGSAVGLLRFLSNLDLATTEEDLELSSRDFGLLNEKDMSFHTDITWGFDPFRVFTLERLRLMWLECFGTQLLLVPDQSEKQSTGVERLNLM